jgi:DNA-binding transcriptional ArsR family regulator
MHKEGTVAVLNALANPIRLGIACRLAAREGTTHSREAQMFANLSQPTMSHHFSILVKAGVLVESPKGTRKYYSLNTLYIAELGINLRKMNSATEVEDLSSVAPMVRRVPRVKARS